MTKTVPPAIAALKTYTKIDNTNFLHVFEGLADESDRAAFIISGSVVEDALNGLLRAHMRSPKNNYERDEIWGPQGVLSNFSQKIKIAYALQLIDLEARNGLDVIREIRNQCAHSMMPLSLKTKALVDACHLLTKPDDPPSEPLSKRDRDLLRAATLNAMLDYAVTFTQDANAKHEHDQLQRAIASPGKQTQRSNPSDPEQHPNALRRPRQRPTSQA